MTVVVGDTRKIKGDPERREQVGIYPVERVQLRTIHVEVHGTAIEIPIPQTVTWFVQPVTGLAVFVTSPEGGDVALATEIDLPEDAVNHPKHYTAHPSGVECIEIVECMAFCLGNAIKYAWRAGIKSKDRKEDLQKCLWYLRRSSEVYPKTAHYSLRREDDRELCSKIQRVLAAEPNDSILSLILRHVLRFGSPVGDVPKHGTYPSAATIFAAIEAEIAKEGP